MNERSCPQCHENAVRARGFKRERDEMEAALIAARSEFHALKVAPIGRALAQRVLDCASDCPPSVVNLARQLLEPAK